MFLKKGVLEFWPISTLSFLVLLEIGFVIKMDLQKICKKSGNKEKEFANKPLI